MSAQSFVTGVPLVPSFVRELAVGNLIGEAIPKSLLLWAPARARSSCSGCATPATGACCTRSATTRCACRLAGVRVWQVLLVTYVLCSILAAIGGVLYVGVINAADLQLVTPYLLPSVAAVVIGGTSIFGGIGGYSGTILGAIILVGARLAADAARRVAGGQADRLRQHHPAAGLALRDVHQARLM